MATCQLARTQYQNLTRAETTGAGETWNQYPLLPPSYRSLMTATRRFPCANTHSHHEHSSINRTDIPISKVNWTRISTESLTPTAQSNNSTSCTHWHGGWQARLVSGGGSGVERMLSHACLRKKHKYAPVQRLVDAIEDSSDMG